MPEDDEAGLVVRARHDRAAFAPLYDRYVTAICRYCFRLLGNRQAAEDATSETFTKAIAGIVGYNERSGSGSFRGWLFTIAHNIVMDGRRCKIAFPLDPGWEGVDPDTSPEDRSINRETADDLYAAIAALTADQQAVIQLRLAGLTGVEIAQVLDRTPQAIKSTQFRAITQLRARLRDGKEGHHARRA